MPAQRTHAIGNHTTTIVGAGPTSAGRTPTYALCVAERWGMRFSDADPDVKGQLMFPVARDYAFAVHSLFERIQWGNTFFGKGEPALTLTWPIDDMRRRYLLSLIKPIIRVAMTAQSPNGGGIPDAAVPDEILLDVVEGLTPEQGYFDAVKWRLILHLNALKELMNLSRFDPNESGERSSRFKLLKTFVDTIYHEARHCQQWFWMFALALQHPDNFPGTHIDKWPDAVVEHNDAVRTVVALAGSVSIPDDPLLLASIKRMAVGTYAWVLNLWRINKACPTSYLPDLQSLEKEYGTAKQLAVDLLQKSGYGGKPIDIEKMVAEPNCCAVDYRSRPWENDAFYCGDMAAAYFMQAGKYGLYTHAEDECSAPYAAAYEHPDPPRTDEPAASGGQ